MANRFTKHGNASRICCGNVLTMG
jgi:hypothetical protein